MFAIALMFLKTG